MSVATPQGTTLRQLGKSWGVWLIVIMVAVIILSLIFGYEKYYDALDPRSAQPDGSRALVEVLKDQGVDVQLVFNAKDLPKVDQNTTVMVSRSPHFDTEDENALPDFVKPAGRAVFTGMYSLETLGIDSEPGWADMDPDSVARDSACGDLFGKATQISANYDSFVPSGEYGPTPPRMCFKSGKGYYVGVWPKTEDHGQYVWITNPNIFRNQSILDNHNAAALLTVLGNNDRLVWFYPTAKDTTLDPTEVGVWSLLPRWTYSTALVLLLAALAFMFYRGRRFGPLAYERLPVTVKSSETVISHGHLVHETRDTGWAIAALQTQARRKIRKALLLPDEISTDAFLFAVANRVGRPEREIYNLLFAPFTGNEDQMVQRAKELDGLIEEVVHD